MPRVMYQTMEKPFSGNGVHSRSVQQQSSNTHWPNVLIRTLDILHHKENICDQCNERFADYKDLIAHARHVHHHTIVKCEQCGKEFIHEKDRLHHSREEHKQKLEDREHKNLHEHGHTVHDPQQEVDEHTRQFSDNF